MTKSRLSTTVCLIGFFSLGGFAETLKQIRQYKTDKSGYAEFTTLKFKDANRNKNVFYTKNTQVCVATVSVCHYRLSISASERLVIRIIKLISQCACFISFAVCRTPSEKPCSMPSAKAISRSSALCTAISVS